jgi:hypothetical protein
MRRWLVIGVSAVLVAAVLALPQLPGQGRRAPAAVLPNHYVVLFVKPPTSLVQVDHGAMPIPNPAGKDYSWPTQALPAGKEYRVR